jgi:hypothetical protein
MYPVNKVEPLSLVTATRARRTGTASPLTPSTISTVHREGTFKPRCTVSELPPFALAGTAQV